MSVPVLAVLSGTELPVCGIRCVAGDCIVYAVVPWVDHLFAKEGLQRAKRQLYSSAFKRTVPVYAGAAGIALVSNSHLCHLPEVNEPLVRSGPSMFHVKRGGRIHALIHRTPCRLGV
jgi:hypothetical protein